MEGGRGAGTASSRVPVEIEITVLSLARDDCGGRTEASSAAKKRADGGTEMRSEAEEPEAGLGAGAKGEVDEMRAEADEAAAGAGAGTRAKGVVEERAETSAEAEEAEAGSGTGMRAKGEVAKTEA